MDGCEGPGGKAQQNQRGRILRTHSYQAAVLGELSREVYSIEIVEPLAESAARDLARLGYHNVHVRAGDGYRG